MKKLFLLMLVLPILSCGVKKELVTAEKQKIELEKRLSNLEKKQEELQKQNMELSKRLEKQVSKNKILTNNVSILENVNKDLVVRNDSLFSQLLQIVELNGKNKDFKLPASLKKNPSEKKTETDYYDEIPPPPKIKPRIEKIFNVVEKMPKFPGGETKMFKFIEENLKYPSQAEEVTGTVYVRFIVNDDGVLRDIEIVRGIGYGYDKEALRIIRLMPKWEPGKQRGKPVATRMILPIKFK